MKNIIVALDFPSSAMAISMCSLLDPELCRVKIGKELFTEGGPDLVKYIISMGFDVFLDLKYHDIPNTAAAACVRAANMGVWMMNIHASGGEAMIRECVHRLKDCSNRVILVAVTVLTSLDDYDLRKIYGPSVTVSSTVKNLAVMAKENGADGVVCSPLDLEKLKAEIPGFIYVTPGIRPSGSDVDDQKRLSSPATAVANGSNFLVIGRPVTRADNPMNVIHNIYEEINLEKR